MAIQPGTAPDPTVVFVVGCPRSGTTLVQQLLNAHPAVTIGPETFFVRRFWLGRGSAYEPGSDAEWAALLEELAAIPELGAAGIREQDLAAAVDAAGSGRDPGTLLEQALRAYASRKGGTRIIGEKTPNHLLYMPLLQEWIPDARFIHVVRDPRAVVSSWRRVPWSSGTVYGDAAVWRRYMETARRNPPAAGNLLEMRYEGLVTDPEPETRRMLEFLGLDFDGRVLEHHQAPAVGIDPEREPWKRGALRPISTEPVDRWRADLSAWQILQVEATVGQVLERRGYLATTSSAARIALGPPLRALARGRVTLRRMMARR